MESAATAQWPEPAFRIGNREEIGVQGDAVTSPWWLREVMEPNSCRNVVHSTDGYTIEKMERETGFEPATSSLGRRRSIANTGQCVFLYPFWRMEFSPVSALGFLQEPDRAQIEHTNASVNLLCAAVRRSRRGTCRSSLGCTRACRGSRSCGLSSSRVHGTRRCPSWCSCRG